MTFYSIGTPRSRVPGVAPAISSLMAGSTRSALFASASRADDSSNGLFIARLNLERRRLGCYCLCNDGLELQYITRICCFDSGVGTFVGMLLAISLWSGAQQGATARRMAPATVPARGRLNWLPLAT